MANVFDQLKLGTKVQNKDQGGSDSHHDRLIDMVQSIDTLKKYQESYARLKKGSLDVPAFLQELSIEAVMVVAADLTSDDPDRRSKAAKDVLDRAGHGKTQKIAVGHMHVDRDTTKRELVNLVMSAAKRTGMAVKEEKSVQGSSDLPSGDTIDAHVLQDGEPSK